MKFLVYGSNGWIGGMLRNYIHELGHDMVSAESRADNEKHVAEELDNIKPDRVISVIGRTRGPGFNTIDYLEQRGKLLENMRDNLYGPMALGFLCQKRNIHFTYLGTGCIFHYDTEHPDENFTGFTESSLPNFFGSSYSTCKGFTDRLMHFMEDSVLNVRIRMPITSDHSPYNFITKIVKYQKVINIPNSMTVLPDLLPKMIDMSIREKTGTINLTNPGAISHNEVLELYKKHVDPDFFFENFTIEEQDKILLAGRSNNLLETDVLKADFPDVDEIHVAVEKICIEMAKLHGKINHGKKKSC